ncbi:GDP-mannose-dependent alpha-(1-6)-phosphatidylinositol dimannoside mannosyltransferase [Stieleria neptunia]|uniref:GDP-mannose-dependent alpha-(1-6)-phosphatidylinositol dimannoside mannosyltransferase n=1 Tax=Stieleria neptunia TaxID=2527979 RepID=A0A518HQS5_9BACT|nr:glycosyltransferase family 4 protein [Stieleria neptunia]QDV43157.1 GDP-mannose-dependent alpha-(1-6)-phosphatidylinositol dimannoside mannosyltransferase [Stieleria neptunia]
MNRSNKNQVPKVAFVTSHPIQYQVPVFRHLHARTDLDFQVLFAMLPDAAAQGAGFGVEFEWDIPLLEGYEYDVLENVSTNPGLTHFRGCDTPGIKDELRRREIDVVIVNGWVVKTCIQTLRACNQMQIPCIVRGEANRLRRRPWWKRMLQRQLVRRYDAYLPIGKANREFYRSYGIDEERMFDSLYCIENERFARISESTEDDRQSFRRRWNLPEDSVCFLFCGKFEAKKHPFELVESFSRAFRSGKESNRMHLLMVGDGELRLRCERLAAEHNLPVTFTGFLNQSEIVASYTAADCLVLPSDHGETWGLVVNEAMACGRPAIVSDQVGCRDDLIIEGETGFSFAFGNWDQLASLLQRASGDEVDLRKMGAAACRRIADYSPKNAAEGIARAARDMFSKANHERRTG